MLHMKTDTDRGVLRTLTGASAHPLADRVDIHPGWKERLREAFLELMTLHRHEGWTPSTYLDTMYMSTGQSDWQMFTATTHIACSPEVCRDFLMDVDRVSAYESMVKEAQCVDTFSHDNLAVELRRFVYTRMWPAAARELLVVSSTMSVRDMVDRGWVSPRHPLTRGEGGDASRTLVIASTSATSRSTPTITDAGSGGQIRAHLYLSGYVMQPRDDGGTELSVFLHVDPRGDLSPGVCNHLIGMSVSALLSNVANALRQYQ